MKHLICSARLLNFVSATLVRSARSRGDFAPSLLLLLSVRFCASSHALSSLYFLPGAAIPMTASRRISGVVFFRAEIRSKWNWNTPREAACKR